MRGARMPFDPSDADLSRDLDVWRAAYPRDRPPPPRGVFEIGLCMAGAISGGAYMAGVIDYLIEALDAFTAEQDRRRGTTEAPLHLVQLPLFGGASAGGMCSSIA